MRRCGFNRVAPICHSRSCLIAARGATSEEGPPGIEHSRKSCSCMANRAPPQPSFHRRSSSPRSLTMSTASSTAAGFRLALRSLTSTRTLHRCSRPHHGRDAPASRPRNGPSSTTKGSPAACLGRTTPSLKSLPWHGGLVTARAARGRFRSAGSSRRPTAWRLRCRHHARVSLRTPHARRPATPRARPCSLSDHLPRLGSWN